jgi:hypothetical protein
MLLLGRYGFGDAGDGRRRPTVQIPQRAKISSRTSAELKVSQKFRRSGELKELPQAL